ncbi:hypothetical protein ACI65C_000018 [Semiaphis heraclei]
MPQHKDFKTALFADDTMFYASGPTTNCTVKRLQNQIDLASTWFKNWKECLATGFRFSVTHDDPPFGQSEPHDGCGKSTGDETLLLQLQQQPDGSCPEKPITCDYLSPYAFTARNSLGSTSADRKEIDLSSSDPLITGTFGFSRLHAEKATDHVENRPETEPPLQEHFGTDHHGRGLAFYQVPDNFRGGNEAVAHSTTSVKYTLSVEEILLK